MGWGSPCWQGGEQASALALGSQMEQLSLPSRSWLHRSCGSGQQSPDSLFFQPARTSMLVSPVMLRNNCSHKSTPNAEARYASALMMDAGGLQSHANCREGRVGARLCLGDENQSRKSLLVVELQNRWLGSCGSRGILWLPESMRLTTSMEMLTDRVLPTQPYNLQHSFSSNGERCSAW